MERKLQSAIIKWLKAKGAYVIKTRPGAGTPVGCPDILFLFKGSWGAIEVKASDSAKWQPGQEATVRHLRAWNEFVFKCYPENWPVVKSQLSRQFFK